MSGRAIAQELVEDIAENLGYIAEDDWALMPERARRRWENIISRKDQLIAEAVNTLAKNIYDSSARFIFELLQNADDNHYSKALQQGELPHVNFHMYSERIIVECNEDGFTPANVKAICGVGKSSKAGSHGYIGEKGIGFKSVFMAAHTAYIQSGDFSFSFHHRHGDSGLGMIIPIWQDPQDEIGDHLTRITLSLHQHTEAEDLARQRKTIREQFADLHATILLFMKNLKQIHISIYASDDVTVESLCTYTIQQRADGKVVRRNSFQDGEWSTEEQCYLTVKHTVTGLAKSENRTYSESEEASQAYSSSDVLLAFPVTAELRPLRVMVSQWIFAFLPVQRLGFKFLIHADFVTQASRQDIVTTSHRNEGLANGIAEAFVKGVLLLCQHESHLFQWMRYLPKGDDYPWNSYWRSVIRNIEDRLKQASVMRLASSKLLRRIASVRRVGPTVLDSNGDPLFADLESPLYLDKRYQSKHLDLLTDLGLQHITMTEVLARVKYDLSLPDSRMKTYKNRDWHDRAAKLLQLPFEHSMAKQAQDLKLLNLLPLTSGKWVSAAAGDIYFPQVGELKVPFGLGLRVIRHEAAASVHRHRLFELVGVQEADISFIRRSILALYPLSVFSTISPSVSADQMRFLYLTDHHAPNPRNYHQLQVFSQAGRLIPVSDDHYIPDDNPLGPANLLGPTPPGPNPGDGASGFAVHFLHQDYLDNPPQPPTGQERNWIDWLRFHLGTRQTLRLASRDRKSISPEAKYVSLERPDRYAEFVQALWADEGRILVDEVGDFALTEISCSKVPCVDGTMLPLCDVFLPTEPLKSVCARFLRAGEFFPWLKTCSPVRAQNWKHMANDLKLLLPRSNLNFALKILTYLKQANTSNVEESLSEPDRLYNLYRYLQGLVQSSEDPRSSQNVIRRAFSEPDAHLIYSPKSASRPDYWNSLDDVVWESPLELMTKECLERRYQGFFRQFDNDRAHLTDFFRVTLQIPDCGLEHVLDEIRELRDSETVDFDRTKELYAVIHDVYSADAMTEVKEAFLDEDLIYSFTAEMWLSTSQCLWSSATQIPGMVTLKEEYEELRDFFLDVLEVSEMTLPMVLDKLGNEAVQLTVQDAKDTLLSCSYLLEDEDEETLARLRQERRSTLLKRRIFPVKLANGELCLCQGSEQFALIDRDSLAEEFDGKAKFLAFSMDETRLLQPAISWFGFEGRYLSKMVREISSADSASTRPVSAPQSEIRRKAHALLRIAKTYNSPRTRQDLQPTYFLLRNSKTLETTRIVTQLHLSQDGVDVVVEKQRGIAVHIHESPEGLRIYIPKNKRDRGACFQTKLPQRLCEWLMTDPTTQLVDKISDEAILLVLSVLNAAPYSLSGILSQYGITTVHLLPDEGEYGVEEDSDNDLDGDVGSSEGSSESMGADTTERLASWPGRSSSEEWPLDADRNEFSESDEDHSTTPPTAEHAMTVSHGAARHNYDRSLATTRGPVPSAMGVDTGYLAMLTKSVAAARRAEFPSRGPFNMSPVQAAISALADHDDDSDTPFRLRSASRIERDCKVGAAGELYVFELLSGLSPRLPAFDRENWQSTIRKHVNIHPDYADLPPWVGHETADITYHDRSGVLTSLLADKGYLSHLSADQLANATPQYFIEVKSTTQACETAFFMNKYQYTRMQDCSYNRTANVDRVYAVFRVYNLGRNEVGLKVFVDPERMRLKGELAFTAENWSVVQSIPHELSI